MKQKSWPVKTILVFAMALFLSLEAVAADDAKPSDSGVARTMKLATNTNSLVFIDTSFENASPVWYESAADGTILVHLLYDHERSSPNRAAGHIHFLLHALPGSKLTLEFMNLDNVWNGTPGSVAKELKTLVVSENGRDWKPMATEALLTNRVRLTLEMPGKDLNRDWDTPADPQLAPENAALENWLQAMIESNQRPHLALELHNDGGGLLHISRPPVPDLQRHIERMVVLEARLRKHTWFTEGSTKPAFHNSGTLGDRWLERYGIDAVVHEFNCNRIAGLKDYPSAKHWREYGEKLATVFFEYFGSP